MIQPNQLKAAELVNFKPKSLGRVEMEVLQFVVDNHPICVKDVAAHMAEVSGQARTTILTVLERLRNKKFLTRRKIDGVNHYSSTIEKSEFMQGMVGEFIDDVMQGSVSPFVAYLDQRSSLSPDECDQLRRLVDKLDSNEKNKKKKS